ncbi:hypothetical protein M4I21_13940 [Cellulophaga sp. 20_2_10]|uniref:hypothetical protein n=1 Tax=Cellulophaga sp. 20_2_10 TaxID=2942476 RepID=UPI00201A4876|nr:hypothetical protein [Cellulophaga sp. 20_2_10]MCL5246919.1 hypothetical protein [Cellulophaga sp. 20_2_10]
MKKDPELFYLELVRSKNYNLEVIERKFLELKIDVTKYSLYKVKSAIVFVSHFENEIDAIITIANANVLSILNAATVKEERG